jgi:hypothetical protein
MIRMSKRGMGGAKPRYRGERGDGVSRGGKAPRDFVVGRLLDAIGKEIALPPVPAAPPPAEASTEPSTAPPQAAAPETDGPGEVPAPAQLDNRSSGRCVCRRSRVCLCRRPVQE